MFPLSDGDLVTRRRPIINIILIVICAAVFFYELAIGELGRVVFFYRLGLIPAELTSAASYTELSTDIGVFDITSPIPDWLTIVTSMFIHGSWLHFIGNMLFLWVFGDNIEDRFGHFKYLAFYLVAGIAASALHVFTDTASDVPTIGASGAIAGVLGAYIVFFPSSRIRTLVFVFFFIAFPRIPALFLLGFWFGLQFISGIGSLGPTAQAGGVAYWAHIGGFAFGAAIALLYRVSNQIRSRPV